ncbi:hypothetical protein C4552_00295 [Candidatus Parcubacteria bacterium]|nr:MAG: hypothetical protein C4552_00295 [Candidatus Parcubacteria bacterium]
MAGDANNVQRSGAYGDFMRSHGSAISRVHAAIRIGDQNPVAFLREVAAELRRTADRLDQEAASLGAVNGHHPSAEC